MAGNLMYVNPKNRKTPTKRKTSSVSRSVTKKTTHRYRKNPVGGRIFDTVKSGVIGGAGAVAVEAALNQLPIPTRFKTGPMGNLTTGLGALAMGGIVGTLFRQRKLGKEIAEGAITVTSYNLLKSSFGGAMGLGNYGEGLLGEYGEGGLLGDDMGYYSPGASYPGNEMGAIYSEEYDYTE